MPPPLPFPHPTLTIGHDIIHLPRLQRLLTKSSSVYLPRFLRRILTPSERASLAFRTKLAAFIASAPPRTGDASRVGEPDDSEPIAPLTSWLGGRWAAKEAAFKALGSGWSLGLAVAMERRGVDGVDGAAVGDEGVASQISRRRRWGWYDVEVRVGNWAEIGVRGENNDGGQARVADAAAPYLVLYDPWEEGGKEERQGRIARVSISHDGEYASAVVMVAL